MSCGASCRRWRGCRQRASSPSACPRSTTASPKGASASAPSTRSALPRRRTGRQPSASPRPCSGVCRNRRPWCSSFPAGLSDAPMVMGSAVWASILPASSWSRPRTIERPCGRWRKRCAPRLPQESPASWPRAAICARASGCTLRPKDPGFPSSCCGRCARPVRAWRRPAGASVRRRLPATASG